MYKSVLSSKLEGGRGGYVDHVSLFPEGKGNRLNLNSSENVTCMGDEDTREHPPARARARTHTHTHTHTHTRGFTYARVHEARCCSKLIFCLKSP